MNFLVKDMSASTTLNNVWSEYFEGFLDTSRNLVCWGYFN